MWLPIGNCRLNEIPSCERRIAYQRADSDGVCALRRELRTRYLGRYPTEKEAAHAWDNVAFKYKGRNAKLNFHPRTHEELGGLKRPCDIEKTATRSSRRAQIGSG